MADNGLPCLDLLKATPGILRGLMSELTDDDACWKPAPDRFSVAEVLAHLSHSEGHCYRMRVDRFLAETRPTFEPDDAQMYLELYRDADPKEAFKRALPSEAGDRVALNQMLHEWALHLLLAPPMRGLVPIRQPGEHRDFRESPIIAEASRRQVPLLGTLPNHSG